MNETIYSGLVYNFVLLLLLSGVVALLLSPRVRRLFVFILASLYCLPLMGGIRTLKFVIKTISWFVRKQIKKGKYTILIRAMTKATYWLYVVRDYWIADFNKVVELLGETNMAIVIQRAGQTEVYVPKSEDPNDPNRAEFHFQKLRATRRAEIRDGMVGLSKGRVNQFRTNTVALQLVLEGLIGWQGIVDENGEPQLFDPQDKERSFDLLPVEIQNELLEKFGGGGEQEQEDQEDAPEGDE